MKETNPKAKRPIIAPTIVFVFIFSLPNVKICSTRTRVEHNRLVCASTREREKAFPQTDNLSPKPAASFSFPPSNFPDRGGLTSPPLGAPVSSNSVEPPERPTAALS